MQITKTYARLIDSLTIEEAPRELGGIAGFNHNEELCGKYGYKELKRISKSGNLATYEDRGAFIQEVWKSIDMELYGSRTAELIREKYSIDAELAVHRRKDINPVKFKDYSNFCETCKKKAKMEQIEDNI
jgi:hypothetical protein